MHSNNPLGLLDVVCGEPADVGSVHKYVHAGALFCFCSDECLARFIVDPTQFVAGGARAGPLREPVAARASASVPARAPVAVASGGNTPAANGASVAAAAADKPPKARLDVTQPAAIPGAVAAAPEAAERPAPSASGRPNGAGTDAAPGVAVAAVSTRGAPFVEPAPVPPQIAPALGPIAVSSTSSGNLFESLFAWREKRFAVRTCADLLKLHKIVAARNPGLAGPQLYRQIVAAHNGGDLAYADAVLANAEQSFAIWPVQRALKFADVVHYLAASEFLATTGGGRWIHANMKRIVAARIPHEL